MKLIFCPECEDVVKLDIHVRTCKCEASWGYYRADGLNAFYFGCAIPLGFENSSLITALNNQPNKGMGERFDAFVVPKSSPTFKGVKV